jgi:hypothetical protein
MGYRGNEQPTVTATLQQAPHLTSPLACQKTVMQIPNFISIPITTTACVTCAHWEGARVLLNGYCHSLLEAAGCCRNFPDDESKTQNWSLSMELGPKAKCENWYPAE